jgi:putative ABC transport system permease protein
MYHNIMTLQRTWYLTQVGHLDKRAQQWPFPEELMGRLETLLGVKLFQRSRSESRLTREGQILLAEARHVLERVDHFRAAGVAFGEKVEPELTLSVSPILAVNALAEAAREFRDRFPHTLLRIYGGNLGATLQDVASGRATIGFTGLDLSAGFTTVACGQASMTRVALMAGTKDGTAGASAGSSQKWARQVTRRMLVSAQVAFSFAVLIAAGLLVRSLVKLQEVNPGFEAQHVFAMRLHPNWSKVNGQDDFRGLFRKVLEEIRQSPGVIAAGVSGSVPLDKSGALSRELFLEGQTQQADAPPVNVSSASPGYFAALRVPLLRGRDFEDADREGAPIVAIVNQTLAQRRWPDVDPVGQRFRIPRLFGISPDGWITVVGVAGDMRSTRLDREPTDQVFLSFEQAFTGVDVVIRTGTDLAQSIQNARRIVAQVDPETALVSVRTMEEIVAENLAAPQLTTQLLGLLAALTLVITVTGIGGVAAVAASQRRAELGIRLALGARPRALIAMVVGQEMRMVLAGLAIGLIAALALARMLRTFLFGVPPTDPFTFATAAIVMLSAAVVACLIPAIRAARVDPFETLRSD